MVFEDHWPLVEKFGHVHNRDVVAASKYINDFLLGWEGIQVWFHQLVESTSIHDWVTLSWLARLTTMIDDKNGVGAGCVVDYVGHVPLLMQLVEYLVDDLMVKGAYRVGPIALNLLLPSFDQRDPHLALRWNLHNLAIITPQHIILVHNFLENLNSLVITIDGDTIGENSLAV